jgi:hypothetical protein
MLLYRTYGKRIAFKSGLMMSDYLLNRKKAHISTGGGASLELLEGKDLPGVIALDDKFHSLFTDSNTNQM